MDWQMIVTLLVGPLSGLGGWFVGQRQRAAATTGIEHVNEGKAIELYESMTHLAQGLQDRLVGALSEIDRFRVELAVCVEAREQARRDGLMREQQARIDKTALEVTAARLRHDLATMQAEIVELKAHHPV